MSERRTAEMLETWALEEGFDRAGVAPLRPSDHHRAFLQWLDRGDHAGMRYLERRSDERRDPRQLLDGAQSVLCVALQYHPLAGASEPAGDLWPGVARYARGRDYHPIMKKRLRRLALRIEAAYPSARTRWYVDTGPVLERELAARAGLGAFGKNTNLLHPDGGSWFLLGEVFLTLTVSGGPPLADLCGSCTACLEACPTGALPHPYRLDSRRCISFWTIEHRGPIPADRRASLAGWVFGCDICQEVCPLNAEVAAADHPELELPAEREAVDLTHLLALDRKRYDEAFRASPMRRATLPGLRRNAAVAMGNSRQPRYRSALIAALSDGDPIVRGHAAWALGRVAGDEAHDALAGARALESEPSVRAEIERALAAIRTRAEHTA